MVHPGEQIQTVCEYDTSKRLNTRFGLATQDEMCIDFLFYWPLQVDAETGHEINVCSYAKFEGQNSTTICGDHGRIDEMFSEQISKFPLVKNPSFNDTDGAFTNFGSSDSKCFVEEQEFETPAAEITDETDKPETNGTDINALFSCFSTESTVLLRTGKTKIMRDLKVGDEVLVGPNVFSTVFMFTHSDPKAKSSFLRLVTASNHTVSLTASHFLYVNGLAKAARTIRIGDLVRLDSGLSSRINKISSIVSIG